MIWKTLRRLVLVFGASFLLAACVGNEHEHEHEHTGVADEHGHVEQVSGHAGHDHGVEANDHDHAEHPSLDSDESHEHEAEDEHNHAPGEPESEQDQEHDHVGDTIIHSGEAWEELVGLEFKEALVMPIEPILAVPGRIQTHPDLVAFVSPFIESSVNEVFVTIGDRIGEGDLLVCLTSPEIGMLRAEYDKAGAELTIAQAAYDRTKRLYDEDVLSAKTFQEAELQLNVATVNREYARKKLLALGLSEEQIDNPPTGHADAVGSTIHVTSPLSGRVIERNASVGQKVGAHDRLFEIVDLSKVRLSMDLFEKDIRFIENGVSVRARVSAYPGEVFEGRVIYVGGKLDPEKKTVPVLAEIVNNGEKLKPGMFADAVIAVGGETERLVVPRDAVLSDENLHIVFLKEDGGYHRHVVETGIETDEYIEIVNGISAGDLVVTKGNYQLKSKQRMGAIDPHAGHNH